MATPDVDGMQNLTATDASNENAAPKPHPRASEIIRQVEFYFGDDNLPHDAHLLGLFQEGNCDG